MAESLLPLSMVIGDQDENITTDKLKIYFDNAVDELNTLMNQNDDIYIQSVDTIVTNLLNINIDQLSKITILDHPLIFMLRDLIIKLLQEKNIVAINIITLFTKLYLKIKDDFLTAVANVISLESSLDAYAQSCITNDKLSKLCVVFFHQPLLDVLVHHRINEEFSDIINQFLINIIGRHKKRYDFGEDESGPYLDEVVTYVCSSAYIDVFNHLLTRLVPLEQSELDDIEQFYLIKCPNYICYSRKNDCYIQVLTFIFEKMSQIYFNILNQFTKTMKNCSQIIIEPVICLMALLQCVSVSHELRQKFTSISENLINVMWTIIYELSSQNESHTDALVQWAIVQMFSATFKIELLPKIKEINMIPTLLELLNHSKNEQTQVESCRLLAAVMDVDDIQNRLTNPTKIITVLLTDLRQRSVKPVYKLQLENNLLCLKNLIQNKQVKMELIKQNGLPFLINCITNRKQTKFHSVVTRQRVLEILLDLTSDKKAFTLLQQNHLFLFHVKKLTMSSSEHDLQLAAQAIVQKLETYQKSINTTEKQDKNTNIIDNLAIVNKYDIFISYSPVDRDICYQIRDQLVYDNFRVKIGLDFLHDSTIKVNANAIEYPKVKCIEC
ncbi:unnamed protein product [Rotaria sp. Silwood1]|nr:unnamed protein product [Rotaria sp. Silwood1]CAF1582066.1 unnamed protein product [Rotaria sp. Silwood1]CAF1586075.1 unnamed protein product [Rotaria sp. Silwood1]CAF3679772.1 unnamed protein product [Rotaria sp. Silwood1]CAF3711646.1 unnamed protein product [Rotaria sp. Silwood1]